MGRDMKRILTASSAILLLVSSVAQAASLLSERQARAKAIHILQGDPYGKTPAEVASHIKDAALERDGMTKACGAKGRPAWEFRVVVVTADKDQFNNGVIDGFLALDARSGALLCANLPLLE
jgi:hypothetical protein